MFSTFQNNDCIFLLKDLTGIIPFTSFEQKEAMIAAGLSYSEMITMETAISKDIDELFIHILEQNASVLASCVGRISETIYNKGKENSVIVSLARAGSPIGALIRRYIRWKYNVALPHYSISIIRGKGIDEVALDYIVKAHPNGILSFVDGWTGKGSITMELNKAVRRFNINHSTSISTDLAVLADPAALCLVCGTREDICIPNACLNSTVSGFVSRTIHNETYCHPGEFHGAVVFKDLQPFDRTNLFIDTIASHFSEENAITELPTISNVQTILEKIQYDFHVSDVNKIKLSIGESSRALIRRKPKKILVKNPMNPNLAFIRHMASIKNIDVTVYDTMDYECITIIN